MFSIAGPPIKQSVGETITTLSGRLGSATLLEDRRAAILGLRSFAKDFPASVASGAVRGLITCLRKDGEDIDTVKIVLETLLMLFNPNEQSLESSLELSLWLADEFTQRGENIALLVDFMSLTDFHCRLYSLKLIGAILSARTERTEECLFNAPLAISRLVSILEDNRESIRTEGVGLLISLTLTSIEIQKLVAFENAFELILAIIMADGSLTSGGQISEECLILLANLLRVNSSNQSLFRESGCIIRLTEMLAQLLEPRGQADKFKEWTHAQGNRNLYAFLSIIRLFLAAGGLVLSENQNAFWRQGLSNLVLQLGFDPQFQIQLRAEALIACGDLIRGNKVLQEEFAHLMVNQSAERVTAKNANGHAKSRTYAVDGLLDSILNLRIESSFDLRFAACECLKAYFSNNSDIRLHFLHRAIEGYQSPGDDSTNILTVLLNPSYDRSFIDPYRDWFAAVIAFHLLYDNPTAKAMARGVTEGDASKGEEVVTGIQTIAAHLLTGVRQGVDSRILTGYLMLLLGWLFEDLDAVNDLLAEGSNMPSLIQLISQPSQGSTDNVVQGLSAMLIALSYEFSTKDSPISRATLHSIILSHLDRENFLDRLAKLRSLPLLRDFEVTPQKLTTGPTGDCVDVFFDDAFVAFFKDNYGRLARALDRSPLKEISVFNDGEERGISRELVDSLRCQVKEKEQQIIDAKEANRLLEERLKEEQAMQQRLQSEAAADISLARARYDELQKTHEKDMCDLRTRQIERDGAHQESLAKMKHQLKKDYELSKAQMDHIRRTAQIETENIERRADIEIARLRATVSTLELDLEKANTSKGQELDRLQARLAEVMTEYQFKSRENESRHEETHRALQGRLEEALRAVEQASARSAQMDFALDEAIKARAETQSELDDLLIVLGDLEEQIVTYEKQLEVLGHSSKDSTNNEDKDKST